MYCLNVTNKMGSSETVFTFRKVDVERAKKVLEICKEPLLEQGLEAELSETFLKESVLRGAEYDKAVKTISPIMSAIKKA